jgi:hypothetical protein
MEHKERETKCQLQGPRIQNNLEKRALMRNIPGQELSEVYGVPWFEVE